MPHAEHELHEIAHELHRLKRLIVEILLEPEFELDLAMSALDDLDAEIARTKTLADALAAATPPPTGGATEAQLAARVATLKAINDETAGKETQPGTGGGAAVSTVLPATFPAPASGAPLTGAFTAADGSTGNTFGVSSGTFFAGCSVNLDGTYAGTVGDATGAVVAFSIELTDSANVVSAPTDYSVTVG